MKTQNTCYNIIKEKEKPFQKPGGVKMSHVEITRLKPLEEKVMFKIGEQHYCAVGDNTEYHARAYVSSRNVDPKMGHEFGRKRIVCLDDHYTSCWHALDLFSNIFKEEYRSSRAAQEVLLTKFLVNLAADEDCACFRDLKINDKNHLVKKASLVLEKDEIDKNIKELKEKILSHEQMIQIQQRKIQELEKEKECIQKILN